MLSPTFTLLIYKSLADAVSQSYITFLHCTVTVIFTFKHCTYFSCIHLSLSPELASKRHVNHNLSVSFNSFLPLFYSMFRQNSLEGEVAVLLSDVDGMES